jgi:hypothetical protein
LQAKNQKRLLAKVRELADVCMQRQIQGSGNYDVYTDAKGHAKGDFEVKLGMLLVARTHRGAEYIAGCIRLVATD